MEQILVDTDVIIDFLRGYQKRIKDLFLKIKNKTIIPHLTFLNILELYSGKDVDQPKKELALQKLLTFFKVCELTYENAQIAGRLRKKHQLSVTDALMASTCLDQNLKLFTFNQKHFQKIHGVILYKI